MGFAKMAFKTSPTDPIYNFCSISGSWVSQKHVPSWRKHLRCIHNCCNHKRNPREIQDTNPQVQSPWRAWEVQSQLTTKARATLVSSLAPPKRENIRSSLTGITVYIHTTYSLKAYNDHLMSLFCAGNMSDFCNLKFRSSPLDRSVSSSLPPSQFRQLLALNPILPPSWLSRQAQAALRPNQ